MFLWLSMKEQVIPHNTMIQFRRIGLGAANGVGKNGWMMKTLRQHFQDEGFLGVSCWSVHVECRREIVELDVWSVSCRVVTC